MTTKGAPPSPMSIDDLAELAATHCRAGQTVLVLTRGYHWVGRIAAATALQLVIVEATCFVDLGQIADAMAGHFSSEARGRQVPPRQPVAIYRPGSEVIDWPYTLPTKAIG